MSDDSPILITGGTGFVGRHLLAALDARMPDRRRLLVSVDPDDGSGEERIYADITDEAALDAIVAERRPGVVVHLAAQASVGTALHAGAATWRVNFQGTLNLALAIGRHVPSAVLLNASTAEVYGDSFRQGIADEDSALRPVNAYARSKAAAEAMLIDLLPESARLIVVRPFNHTGPGQDDRFAIPNFARQIARIEAGKAEPRLMVGNLAAERTFLDVRDVVRAYVMLIDRSARLPSRNVFNIASDRVEPLGSVIEMLISQSGARVEIVPDPARMRPSEIPVARGSHERIRAAIGWQPEIDLERTLADVLAFQRKLVEKHAQP